MAPIYPDPDSSLKFFGWIFPHSFFLKLKSSRIGISSVPWTSLGTSYWLLKWLYFGVTETSLDYAIPKRLDFIEDVNGYFQIGKSWNQLSGFVKKLQASSIRYFNYYNISITFGLSNILFLWARLEAIMWLKCWDKSTLFPLARYAVWEACGNVAI